MDILCDRGKNGRVARCLKNVGSDWGRPYGSIFDRIEIPVSCPETLHSVFNDLDEWMDRFPVKKVKQILDINFFYFIF